MARVLIARIHGLLCDPVTCTRDLHQLCHFRAFYARPREAPGLSVGDLQVARRQVTLKPPLAKIQKGPRLLTGALIVRRAGVYSAAIRSACAVRSMM